MSIEQKKKRKPNSSRTRGTNVIIMIKWAARQQQLADAWDKYEKARAESVDLRADVDRVRIEADRYRAELSRANSDSCTPFRKRLARCTDLLAEGASLSSEGAGLAERVAARKDAVVKIHSTQ